VSGFGCILEGEILTCDFFNHGAHLKPARLEFAGHRRVTKGAFGQNNLYNSTVLVRIFLNRVEL
jgi:hypothetical protein